MDRIWSSKGLQQTSGSGLQTAGSTKPVTRLDKHDVTGHNEHQER